MFIYFTFFQHFMLMDFGEKSIPCSPSNTSW